MQRFVTALFTLSVVLMTASGTVISSPSVEVTRNLTSMPLAFTENQGQWDEQVAFRANAGGATMWFTSDGAVYQFTRTIKAQKYSIVDKRYGMMPSDVMDHEPDSIESIAIKASFIGANAEPQVIGLDAMEYKCNYFIGNDPNEWHTDVPNYQAIVYEDIYSGIDLKYYGNGKQMEYDFIVSPGADYSQIAIQYEGAESISINADGELVIETKWGEVIEQRPVIYQVENNSRMAIAGEYRLKGDYTFGFEISSYIPDLPLIIDPVLVYSTYLGGAGSSDIAKGIALDRTGSAYITGHTTSADFPTVNPIDSSHGWPVDAFVTKLSPAGNSLVYSTYLGGSNNWDYGVGIAVDASGSAYITGYTESPDFPTVGAYDSTLNDTDAFVAKLNPTGDNLVYSTYLGGSDGDSGYGVALDGAGSAYVTGRTYSADFPTVNPFDSTFSGGYRDAFVTKLTPAGDSLVYSTYLGGNEDEAGNDIALDGFGNAYITGGTSSPDFPLASSLDGTLNGYSDVFVTKLSFAGDSLVYSTYLGGISGETGEGIAVDGAGNVYLTGKTYSADFPTVAAFDSILNGLNDVFVTKLSPTGDSLIYSTYLGGGDEDRGYGIAVDDYSCAYITGETRSTNFPTEGWYQTHQGFEDAFVTKLDPDGSLVYSTYLGGSNNDDGYGIAVDGFGNAYITGGTSSPDFPTEGEYQTYQGYGDAFVTKLNSSGNGLVYSTFLGESYSDYGRGIAVDGSGNAYITGETNGFPTTPDAYDTSFNIYSDAFVAKLEFADPTDVVEFDPAILPTHYNMSQSYPNPFNPTTTIEFNLPKRSHVAVKIYNVLGRQVQSLVDENLSVGNYKVTWDGSTFGGGQASTGVYFYRIVTEDFVETKKMVLLK